MPSSGEPPVDPDFLVLEDVLYSHRLALQRDGGAPGVRDLGMLESAVAMPQQGWGETYLHATVPAMAAAYLFHLVKNHPFADANKRAGLAACLTFLDLNGLRLNCSEAQIEDLVLRVAAGEVGKNELTEVFEQSIVPLEREAL